MSNLCNWTVRRHDKVAAAAAAAAKSLQSCLTLCDPIDGSPLGSSVPGILQARTLEWIAISFSNAGKWKVKVKFLSRVQLFPTPWTAAYQVPLSMGFSRQEYWSGVPLPSPMIRLVFTKFQLLTAVPSVNRSERLWLQSWLTISSPRPGRGQCSHKMKPLNRNELCLWISLLYLELVGCYDHSSC